MAESVKEKPTAGGWILDSQLAVKHTKTERRLAERAARLLSDREGRKVSVSAVFRRGMVQFAQRVVRSKLK